MQAKEQRGLAKREKIYYYVISEKIKQSRWEGKEEHESISGVSRGQGKSTDHEL